MDGNPTPATPYDDLNLQKEAAKCVLSNLQVIKSLHGKNTYSIRGQAASAGTGAT
jgi:hypothetical protein